MFTGRSGSRDRVAKGGKKVAMPPAAELPGLTETAHLLRSPKNARRLLTALRRAESGKGRATSPESLRRELAPEARR